MNVIRKNLQYHTHYNLNFDFKTIVGWIEVKSDQFKLSAKDVGSEIIVINGWLHE